MCRIGIVQPNPYHSRNVGHLFYQFGDMLTTINVDTIICQFLSNDIKFLNTFLHQLTHLVENFIHRSALVSPRDQGDGAVGTMAVATLANLYISIMWRRGQFSRTILTPHSTFLIPRYILQQLLVIELPVPAVYLRDFFLQVSEISFRQASHHEKFLYPSFRLCLCKLKDGVDALLLGIGDEATGIHDDDLPLRIIAIVGTMIAMSLHQAHQHLRVYQILRAS